MTLPLTINQTFKGLSSLSIVMQNPSGDASVSLVLLLFLKFIIYIFFFINTCRAHDLVISPRRFTLATIALFSASEQTHCALVVCNSEWMTNTARF